MQNGRHALAVCAVAGPSGNEECSPRFDQRQAFFRADGFDCDLPGTVLFLPNPEADPEATVLFSTGRGGKGKGCIRSS